MLVPREPNDEPGVHRDAVVEHLRSQVAAGRLELARFEDLVSAAYAADGYDALAAIVAATPPPVTLTPATLRRDAPLEIEVGHGQARLDRPWQLAAETVVHVRHGQAVIDLTKAQWDATDVHLSLIVEHGQISVTVPDGVRVTFDRMAANVVNRLRDLPHLPGAPTLRVAPEVGHGQIVLRSPKHPKRVSAWFRRRRMSRRH